MLAHWPLSQNLSSEKELGVDLVRDDLGLPQHIDPAIDAGVHPGTSSMLGILDQLKIFLAFGYIYHLNTQFMGDLGRMTRSA